MSSLTSLGETSAGGGNDSEDPGPGVLLLPSTTERDQDEYLGALGRPFDRRSPFFIGLSAAFGVGVAYVVVKGLADVSSVLVIIGVALFIAIGLNPD